MVNRGFQKTLVFERGRVPRHFRAVQAFRNLFRNPPKDKWCLECSGFGVCFRNLMGVLHGIRTFLPHIRAHGEGGHIVNTASMAGMNSGLGFSAYSASKFAVVNMSEGLAKQLAPLGIGITVLCPGFVRTRIWESGRNRPERYGPTQIPDPASAAGRLLAQLTERGRAGLDPIDVAAQVLTAIHENELHVFTHPGADWRAELEERFAAILAAMDKAASHQGL